MEAVTTGLYAAPSPSLIARTGSQLTVAAVQLDESVEYKSLPSGLHNVAEDLMYT